ncbi:sulfatase [Jiangella asiatica]|uniref:Sulfatase N-terminal domain-containing protein n=1 Tax=Jiangella asiatica TaxID=2530372 RepID=A0A4R5DQ14_9ACTN|nr:sulfatase [Jiangella asiatica]TDE14270.1 hypothetical protein E1269_03700 [Jiangella asiatica]
MPPRQRPNIIFITCHDLGRFLGCYGVETVRSPALDALAEESVVFERAHCTAPQCSPSRASLFTGRYPHSTGVMGLTQPPFEWDLRPQERHVASLLGGAGYRTALVGIHHESKTGSDDAVAERLGFDVVHQRGQRGEDVTALATAQLGELAGGDRPFYLQVGYLEPHRLRPRERTEDGYQGFLGDYIEPDAQRGVTVPGYLVDDARAREELAELQGAVRYLDTQIGHLMAAVDRLGVRDDTVVVFVTDHGLALPRAKCSLYDPGLEIALMVRYPAAGWGGRRRSELVSGVDLVPTLLEAAGAEPANQIQGTSLSPLLDASPARPWSRDAVFAEFTYHEYYDPRRCVRTDRHKLIANFSVAPAFMDCSSSWDRRTRPRVPMNVPTGFHPPVELYDLELDPLEVSNLAGEPDHLSVETDLLGRLHTWMRDTGDPLLAGAVTPPLHASAMRSLTGTGVIRR